MTVKQFVKDRIVPKINRLLRPLSIRIVGTGDPNRTFDDFFEHLRRLGFKFETVVDIGVAFGSPTIYEANPGARLFLIEPVPACAPVLAKLAAKYGATTFNVAAGAEDGEILFNVHDDVSGSSALKQVEGEALDGTVHRVPVRRLDSLLVDPIARPAFLKIDTQGYEIAVIDGAAGVLKDFDVVLAECSFHAFRHGAPEIGDVIARMKQEGFVPYEIVEGHFRMSDRALGQVDVAFVPEDSPLRADKGAMTPEQLKTYLKRRDIDKLHAMS